MGRQHLHRTEDRTEADRAEGSLDGVLGEAHRKKPKSDENLFLGTLVGTAAAGVGAVIWAWLTLQTSHKSGLLAVGVGFLIGYALRLVGNGATRVFGFVGAGLAILGCMAGNILTACLFLAKQQNISVTDVLAQLNIEVAYGLLSTTFSPIDFLFYAAAVYFAYRNSFTLPEQAKPTT